MCLHRREGEAKGLVKANSKEEEKKFKELEARMKREEAKRKALELGLEHDDEVFEIAGDRFGIGERAQGHSICTCKLNPKTPTPKFQPLTYSTAHVPRSKGDPAEHKKGHQLLPLCRRNAYKVQKGREQIWEWHCPVLLVLQVRPLTADAFAAEQASLMYHVPRCHLSRTT